MTSSPIINMAIFTGGVYGAGYVLGALIKSDPKLMGIATATSVLARIVLLALACKFEKNESKQDKIIACTNALIAAVEIVAMRRLRLIAQVGTAVYSTLNIVFSATLLLKKAV